MATYLANVNLLEAHHGRKTVARAAEGRYGPDVQDALLDVASGTREDWTLTDWEAVLAKLDSNHNTIDSWLKRKEKNHATGR